MCCIFSPQKQKNRIMFARIWSPGSIESSLFFLSLPVIGSNSAGILSASPFLFFLINQPVCATTCDVNDHPTSKESL